MDKRWGRKMIYGTAVLAFWGVLVYGVCYDRTPETALGGSGSAALLEQMAEEEQEVWPSSAEDTAEQARIAVEMAVPGGKQEVTLYSREGEAYLFLPSFADPKELFWKYDERKCALTWNGERVHDGGRFVPAPGETGTLCCAEKGKETKEYQLTVMQSDTLPAVFIGTESGSMEYLNEDKANEEIGTFSCVLADGRLDSAGRLGRISGRGYSSFLAAKKSYGIRFETETDVLGMGSAKRWVLQANAYDLSRMRNKVVYDLAREMGVPYAVESAYADVWFNGEYAGNYLVCEKVEAGPERVDIKRGCLIEGVFASRVEEEAEVSTFFGSDAGWYEVKYPENISDEKMEEMQALMNQVAALIGQSDSQDSYEKLKELVDMESFIRLFLLNELSNEADLNGTSMFYFTADNGKLYAGPVWDYDRSLGNVKSWEYPLLDCFAVGPGEALFRSPYFRQDLAESYNGRYRELMARYEKGYIDGLQREIASSIAMDAVRWSGESENRYTIFNDVCDNFEDGAAYLKDCFGIRYRLIDDLLNEPGKYHQVEFVNTGLTAEQVKTMDSGAFEGYGSQRLWVGHGEMLSEEVMEYLAGKYESSLWLKENGEVYQAGQITEDIRLLSGKVGEEP